jgi:hypothetical protein
MARRTRKSPEAISATRPAAPAQPPPPVPDVAKPPTFGDFLRNPVLWVGLLAVVGTAVVMSLGSADDPAPRRRGAEEEPTRSVSARELKQLLLEKVRGRKRLAAEPWAPRSAEDRVIDQFAKARTAGDSRALALLAGMTRPAEPVSPAGLDAWQADQLLRSPKLRVTRILRGEPDGEGGLRPAEDTYTLQTRGGFVAPGLRVRTSAGEEGPNDRIMMDLDVIVRVEGGRVRAVRAGVHDWAG